MINLVQTPPDNAQSEQSQPAFTGCTLAFLTMHDKLPLVAPALSALGFSLQLASGFDTDQLGTFSGEISRRLSPVETALQKARLAIELTGCRFGLGSEGSFGGGPMPGLVNWDQEILALIDSQSGQQIIAVAAGPVGVGRWTFDSEQLLHLALSRETPGQAQILQLNGHCYKGLTDAAEILALLHQHGWQPGTEISMQPDLRAMHCPERQQYIRKAAEQLASQLLQCCPQCQAPDFTVKQREAGLLCLVCRRPTSLLRFEHYRCDCCGFERRAEIEQYAPPDCCSHCNP